MQINAGLFFKLKPKQFGCRSTNGREQQDETNCAMAAPVPKRPTRKAFSPSDENYFDINPGECRRLSPETSTRRIRSLVVQHTNILAAVDLGLSGWQ
jgi:hypothetical protein